jgi:hypothetical protein
VDHRNVTGEDAEHGLLAGQQLVDVALGVDGQRLRDLYVNTVSGR